MKKAPQPPEGEILDDVFSSRSWGSGLLSCLGDPVIFRKGITKKSLSVMGFFYL